MITRLSLTTLCLLGCLFISALNAQIEPAKPPKLRFLFIDESPGQYALQLGSLYRPVSGNPYEISAPITPADFRPLEIVKTITITNPDTGQPEQKRIPITRVTPPANTTSALVIITPRATAGDDAAPTYQLEILDSDPTLFPPGSIRIINRSPVAMAAQFTDSRVLTAPGETSLARPATDSRHRSLFKIAIQVQADAEGWRLIHDGIAVIRPNERMIGILVYSPGGMRHTFTQTELAEMGPPTPGCFWLSFSDTP